VVALVAFLAADEFRFLTGATIPIDGGRNAVLVDRQYTDYAQPRRQGRIDEENGA
jgi:NAD(P)-dependent dehydrogenase (short-subunit alcohol dehydrogenase family)